MTVMQSPSAVAAREFPAARISVLIVDDEPPARRGLRALLEAHADVDIIGEARNGTEAIVAIQALRPSLVFLDVQMPELDGFDVIRAIGVEQMPVVIFATAFDHAHRADLADRGA